MFQICKAHEIMTSYERVQKTLAFEKPDRVPLDYSANPVIHSQLIKTLGLRNTEDLLSYFGVDFRQVDVGYSGPDLFPLLPDCTVDPEYGYYSRWVQNKYGGYNDFCYFPLKGANSETISSWPLPDYCHYKYENIQGVVSAYREKAIYIGHPGYMDIINSLGRLMGMEECLVNLQLRDEATLAYIIRKTDFEISKLERIVQAINKAGGKVSFLMIGEDLGTQISPMISRELFRDVIHPVLAQYISFANANNLPVMVHTCGASSWVYEDFIAMGVRAIDALQPEAKDMSPNLLASRFGGRLVFHGCISTAAIASHNTNEVADICARTLDIMMPTNGYHFAPSHMIQDNTPIENIITMYQMAHDQGVYV